VEPHSSRCQDINIEYFSDHLQKQLPKSIQEKDNPGFKRAAVLVPLVCIDDSWQILFTRRTSDVQTHKGQVSFPGGMMESSDIIPEQAALRETFEEIGVSPDLVRILGKLDDYLAISNFIVTPVVGILQWPVEFKLSPDEVSRVFTIPLSWLADPENHHEEDYRIINGRIERVVFFRLFDNEKLWGLTARITIEFLKRMDMH